MEGPISSPSASKHSAVAPVVTYIRFPGLKSKGHHYAAALAPDLSARRFADVAFTGVMIPKGTRGAPAFLAASQAKKKVFITACFQSADDGEGADPCIPFAAAGKHYYTNWKVSQVPHFLLEGTTDF